MKYVLLVPWSCKVEDSLEYRGSNSDVIVEEEMILEFETDIMGKKRTFKPTMYKVSKGDKVLTAVLKLRFCMYVDFFKGFNWL